MSNERSTTQDEPSPPLGSWNRMYALVIGTDVVIIILLTLFTAYFG